MEIPARIITDDHRILAVDKPSGLTSEEVARALGRRLVHRIDRATSGLLLLAEDARTVQRMQRLFSSAAVTRTYLALARGAVRPGVIDRALLRRPDHGRRTSAPAGTPGARESQTVVEVVCTTATASLVHGSLVHASLVRASLVTGRTHQVRIHLADTGHPILGDRVYGNDVAEAAPRLMLHAWGLQFIHPNTHAAVALCAPPPRDFAEVVTQVCGAVDDQAKDAHTSSVCSPSLGARVADGAAPGSPSEGTGMRTR